MERKIGEIFEYNGEWYQCIRSSDCSKCDLKSIKDCRLKFPCEPLQRKDCEEVIFKKLEKVGEPYEHYGKLYQCYKLPMEIEIRLLPNNCYPIGKDNLVEIEIKQIKEDMEEKKRKLDKLVEDYSYNRIPYEVFDNCLKQLYVDKQIGENNSSLKEFDLEAAKAGKLVCTRDGRKARVICWDIEYRDNPIAAAVFMGECETVYLYTDKGEYNKGEEDELDLMMLPEKKEGWVNVYKGGLLDTKSYNTRKEAFDKACPKDYVDTVKINWSE